MKNNTGHSGFVRVVAGIAVMAASAVLAFFALPILFPALQVRTFNDSAKETAAFLEQARAAAMLRNLPVACRIETHRHKSVLVLDWNIGGPKLHPEGRRLELPRGVVVSQFGQPETDGTVAVFNPRGGITLTSSSNGSRTAAGVLTALDLSWPGSLPTETRQINIVSGGSFQVENTSFDHKNVQYAAK